MPAKTEEKAPIVDEKASADTTKKDAKKVPVIEEEKKDAKK